MDELKCSGLRSGFEKMDFANKHNFQIKMSYVIDKSIAGANMIKINKYSSL